MPQVSRDQGLNIRNFTVGDGTSDTFDIVHGLNTRSVLVTVYRAAAPYDEVNPVVRRTSTTTITLLFDAPPTTNEFAVMVMQASAVEESVTGVTTPIGRTMTFSYDLGGASAIGASLVTPYQVSSGVSSLGVSLALPSAVLAPDGEIVVGPAPTYTLSWVPATTHTFTRDSLGDHYAEHASPWTPTPVPGETVIYDVQENPPTGAWLGQVSVTWPNSPIPPSTTFARGMCDNFGQDWQPNSSIAQRCAKHASLNANYVRLDIGAWPDVPAAWKQAMQANGISLLPIVPQDVISAGGVVNTTYLHSLLDNLGPWCGDVFEFINEPYYDNGRGYYQNNPALYATHFKLVRDAAVAHRATSKWLLNAECVSGSWEDSCTLMKNAVANLATYVHALSVHSYPSDNYPPKSPLTDTGRLTFCFPRCDYIRTQFPTLNQWHTEFGWSSYRNGVYNDDTVLASHYAALFATALPARPWITGMFAFKLQNDNATNGWQQSFGLCTNTMVEKPQAASVRSGYATLKG